MKQWSIQRTLFKVSDFMSWQKHDELDLSPSFQRRSVWKPGAKSFLIDTILRGLPIPAIVLRLRDIPPGVKTFRTRREVVDGQQRIRTVISFISPNLLSDLKESDAFKLSRAHNRELAGSTFSDLPASLKQHILNYQFMVHVFPSETDDREILEIFARMNSTGYKLNAQELRNSTYFGEFKTQAFALAAEQLQRWRQWHLFTESQIARMAEVEFTSDLMICILRGITANTKSVIDSVYRDFDADFRSANEVARRFRSVFDVIDELPASVRSLFQKKTLFYPLVAALYDVQFGIGSDLKRRAPAPVARKAVEVLGKAGQRVDLGTAPKSVQSALEARVSHASSRRVVTQFLLKTVRG